MISAGTVDKISRESGDWIFVDLGFARAASSCGYLVGSGTPRALTFADLQTELVGVARESSGQLNIVIEAPLSVAFNAQGNPTGRQFEGTGSGLDTGTLALEAPSCYPRRICYVPWSKRGRNEVFDCSKVSSASNRGVSVDVADGGRSGHATAE